MSLHKWVVNSDGSSSLPERPKVVLHRAGVLNMALKMTPAHSLERKHPWFVSGGMKGYDTCAIHRQILKLLNASLNLLLASQKN